MGAWARARVWQRSRWPPPRALVALCLVASGACKAPAREEAPVAVPVEAPVASPAVSPPAIAAGLTPLGGEWVQELLAEDGTPVGIVTLPLGSRAPRPLVVGVHGALSRPDWMCGAVRDSVGPDTFVVCPHPSPKLRDMHSWRSGVQLERAVDRAIEAALARFGERIDTTKLVYFGHSQGSMMLPAAYAAKQPSRPFRGVVFFEGLPKDTGALARTLHNMGAEQVLLVTGQGGWAAAHARVAASLSKRGLHAWHVKGSFGHFFTPAALAIFRRETPALFAPPPEPPR